MNRRLAGILGVPILVLLAPAALLGGEVSGASSAISADPERIRRHIAFLARDELGGRDSGEPGLEVAAEYIAAKFREYGLEPAGDRGSYFQHFSVPRGARFTERGALLKISGGAELAWNDGADVEAFGFSDGAPVVDAPVVFAGYGITMDREDGEVDLAYDDYDGIDVEGKVVIVLRFTPRHGRDDDPFGEKRRDHAALITKLINAGDHGARGAIIVTPPGAPAESIYGLAHRAAPRQPTLPAVLAETAAVEHLLRLRGVRLDRLVEEIAETLEPRSFELEGVTAQIGTERDYLRLRNVAGKLPGDDGTLAAESIVFGAHYDHIGRYGQQVKAGNLGRVHNGADDNASGVAGVLELARLFASRPRPRRSLVFLAFSGEEIGLLGSRHWVRSPRILVTRKHARATIESSSISSDSGHDKGAGGGNGAPGNAPPAAGTILWEEGTLLRATGEFRDGLVEVVDYEGTSAWMDPSLVRSIGGPEPLHRVVAMINLDMIGRAGEEAAVKVLGARSSPAFAPLLERLSEETGVPVEIAGKGGFGGGSDHLYFLRSGIPVLFFFTGIHRLYNTPGDDVETVNVEGEARIIGLVHRVGLRLATDEERPEFDRSVLASLRPRHGKPRLGVRIDTEYRGEGVRVEDVLEDTVASSAGLRPGDIILEVGGDPTADFEALLEAVEKHSGTVVVTVRRAREKFEIEARFPERRGFRVRFGSIPDYAFAEKGVRFEDLQPDSPATKAGVRPGDVLVRWAGKEVRDVEHWTTLLAEHRPGDRVKIAVRRGDEVMELEVVLEGR